MIIDYSKFPETINPVFVPLINLQKKIICLKGGAGSGKSGAIARILIQRSFKYKMINIVLVRQVFSTIRDSQFALLKAIIHDQNQQKYFKFNESELIITNLVTGSKFISKGLDKHQKLASLHEPAIIWIEEAAEIEKKSFDQLVLRLRGSKNSKVFRQIFISFNPVSAESWLKKYFFDPISKVVGEIKKGIIYKYKDFAVLTTTYHYNIFVSDEYKLIFEDLKEKNPLFYQIYALGEWGSLSGTVFDYEVVQKGSEEYFEYIRKMNDYNLRQGLDFGFVNDPSAFLKVSINFDEGYIFIYREKKVENATNPELAKELKPIAGKNTIFADGAEMKSIQELNDNGLSVLPAKKGQGSILFGIMFVKRFKLIVSSSCINCINELQLYTWKKDKNDKSLNIPIDKFNHFMDSLRYAVSYDSENVSTKPVDTKVLDLNF